MKKNTNFNLEKACIAVIGMGYVGLPLAHLFSNKYKVIGFDIDTNRIIDIKNGFDGNLEIAEDSLKENLISSITEKNVGLFPTDDSEILRNASIFIITVPTPVDKNNNPDLQPLKNATTIVGKYLKQGDIVIYESTVYPGVTDEICAPILASISNLIFNVDFFTGYSPERINPGDKNRTIEKIKKITSGSNPRIAEIIDQLYQSVVTAGTHKVSSIQIAEAAKVIENAQRDINIAFVNELAKIFSLMQIDTQEVLEAASTKWNFLPFKPGLVGGHCIGVDPFYLAQKAQDFGYYSELILTARRLNESMAGFVVQQFIKLLIKKDILVNNAHVLVLGITFKENCPDLRNSKTLDIISGLIEYGVKISVFDPWITKDKLQHIVGIENFYQQLSDIPHQSFQGILLSVAHTQFSNVNWLDYIKDNGVIYDVKGILPQKMLDGRL